MGYDQCSPVFFELIQGFCTMSSLSASRWEVASSRINTGAFFRNALAIATRCLCPPERLAPRSPTIVLSPSGRLEQLRTRLKNLLPLAIPAQLHQV
ncbi:MAG: hypothetical protein CM1200mP30_08780 [Pseudomonadota bacterium]|nr:MAG: hypothetical protein CM1200mP30_08780 [Pseudomonadota bacterium]